VLARYQPATTLSGDPAQGRDLFRKHCSVCHRLEEHGNIVGPDLRTVAGKSPGSLLLEIIDPNRNLDSRYLVYAATLKSGQTVAGIITSENATSLTLRQADGQERNLLRADLESLETTGKSLMPEGLEREINPQAMAHLLAYLARQESPAKSLPGNSPATVAITPSGAALQAAQAEVRGGSINFETEFGNIGNWHGQQDTVRWKLKSDQPVTLDVWMDFACAQASAGNTVVVETSEGKLAWKVPSTGPDWSNYQQLKIGRLQIPAGESPLTVRPEGVVTNALVDLRTVYLTAAGTPPVLVAKGQTDVPQSPGELVRAMESGTGDKALIQKLLEQRSDWAADMLQDMTNGLAEGKDEYKAIPLIWRVAIAQGKKGDPATLKAILRVSLPTLEADMRDWQAVVVGGGLINGSTLAGRWPHEEYRDLLAREMDLRKRWDRAIELSFTMANNRKVNTGTRYDALRMVALSGDRSKALELLARYLKPGTDDELVMGAVSGLGDISPDDDPKVCTLLLEALPRLNEENLGMGLGALVRTPARSMALLEAIAAGKVDRKKLAETHRKTLLESKDAAVRSKAEGLLK
jgi:putative heme-binding domain-containing protein